MRRVPEDPGTALFGKTRRRVLGLLFARPDESFFVREIVRRSGAAQGAIARELNLPIRFVGTGEQIDDLVPFDAQTYVNSLFD